MRRLTRRQLVAGGAAVGVAALAAGSTSPAVSVETPAPVRLRVPAPVRAPRASVADTTVEWVGSVARRRAVRLVVRFPPRPGRAPALRRPARARGQRTVVGRPGHAPRPRRRLGLRRPAVRGGRPGRW